MLVELVGKSITGVFALARNQGCTRVYSVVRRANEKVWRLRVELPPR